MRGLYFSDIHFGRKNNSPQHNQDCLDFIAWFCKQVEKEQPDYAAFLGDWFEHRNAINIDTLNYAQKAMAILNDLGIPIYMVVGNHDLYMRHSRDVHSVILGNPFPNITIVDTPTRFKIGNHNLLLSPFLFEHEYELLKEFSDCDIWGGHFEFAGFILTGAYTKSEHGLDPKLFSKPLILSGHFHKRQRQKNIVYIGNTFPMDFADANDIDRGCAIVDHEEKAVDFINWQECPSYVKTTVSEFRQGKIAINEKTRLICEADVSMSFEEQLELKEKITSLLGARGVELQDPDIAAIINDEQEDVVTDTTLKTAEETIVELLSTIEADDIDPQILVKWFRSV